MKVKLISLDKIKPYKQNPRQNEKGVKAVAESIKRFGWRQPIVTDGKLVIIAGHTRYKAAQALGLKRVPVHVAENLSAVQIRAYRLADNRTSELSEWDEALLTIELETLQSDDSDLALALGFSAAEIKALLDPSLPAEPAPVDDVPQQWQVVVTVKNETQQKKLMRRLTREGFTCRAVMS